ncbi:MAG: glycine--tRNA ligase [archaeon]|nr:MAG: glycine--tRNA ligase [archaeon]
MENKLDKIMDVALKRGFFWPSAENYSDKQAGFFDYGPNGRALKENIIRIWRKELVNKEGMIEIDGCQILPKSVFVASGHLTSFNDPLITCKKCKFKIRADQLIQERTKKEVPEKLSMDEYDKLIKKNKIKCPKCKSEFSKTGIWNLMFPLGIGTERKEAYLRGESCQSIFTSFPRIFKTSRKNLPFGIAQTGKVFRNEISPRQNLLRTREFNQAEIEVFFNPETENDFKLKETKLNFHIKNKVQRISVKEAVKKKIIISNLIAHYLVLLKEFHEKLGISEKEMRFRKLEDKDKPFYSKETWDFEVLTSTGWLELVACNHRSDYDLKGHGRISKQKLDVVDEKTGKRVLPNVFELSAGIDRILYALLELNYKEDKKNERTLFSFKPKLAPVFVAIFPLVNKEGMPKVAKEIFNQLNEEFDCFYDESGSIGRRYRRQDEIGTPFCITVDGQTLKDKTVTLRFRDDLKQIRVKITDLAKKLKDLKI